MNRSHVSPWVVRGLYLFALVLVLSPMADLVSTAWPPRPTDLGWRYGFLGLLGGYLHTPILGLVLAMLVAHWQDDAAVLRGLGVAMTIGAVAIMLALAMFALDVLQMRALRAADQRSAVLVGGVLQGLKYGTACLVLVALGYGALRSALHARGGSRR